MYFSILPSPMRKIFAVLFLVGIGASFDAQAKEFPMNEDNPIVAFARDFSGDDAQIMAQVAAFVANPPTQMETIGFHGMGDSPAQSRVFLATVSLLGRNGKLMEVEDKYTYELLYQWRDDGLLDVEALPETAKAVFGPILDENLELDEQGVEAYRALAWRSYAKATEELEQYFASRGKVLLSIDATGGDTLFFALAELQVAERWRDKALARHHDGYLAGVRSPMWDAFWAHLSYALRGLIAEDDQQGYPPGTRLRDETIPFAQ